MVRLKPCQRSNEYLGKKEGWQGINGFREVIVTVLRREGLNTLIPIHCLLTTLVSYITCTPNLSSSLMYATLSTEEGIK